MPSTTIFSKTPSSFLTLRHFDLCSSLISFGGLIAAFIIALIAANDNSTVLMETWNEDLIVVADNDHAFRKKVSGFDNALSETCKNIKNPEAYDIFYRQVSWGPETNFTMVSVSTAGESFDPFLLLIPVLLFSSLFQFFRYFFSVNHERNNDDHGMGWNIVYDPSSGPDLWRWIEYSVTSPLQIVLIAAAFNARENNFLLLMAALQFALVLFGYTLEVQIEEIIKSKEGNANKSNKSQFQNTFALLYYLGASFFFHILIWVVLISKYNVTASSARDCAAASNYVGPQNYIDVILWSQFVAFTLFGVVLTIQVGYVLINLDDLSENENSRKKMWRYVTIFYSGLSIVAKTFLEYGMIGTLAFFNTR